MHISFYIPISGFEFNDVSCPILLVALCVSTTKTFSAFRFGLWTNMYIVYASDCRHTLRLYYCILLVEHCQFHLHARACVCVSMSTILCIYQYSIVHVYLECWLPPSPLKYWQQKICTLDNTKDETPNPCHCILCRYFMQ